MSQTRTKAKPINLFVQSMRLLTRISKQLFIPLLLLSSASMAKVLPKKNNKATLFDADFIATLPQLKQMTDSIQAMLENNDIGNNLPVLTDSWEAGINELIKAQGTGEHPYFHRKRMLKDAIESNKLIKFKQLIDELHTDQIKQLKSFFDIAWIRVTELKRIKFIKYFCQNFEKLNLDLGLSYPNNDEVITTAIQTAIRMQSIDVLQTIKQSLPRDASDNFLYTMGNLRGASSEKLVQSFRFLTETKKIVHVAKAILDDAVTHPQQQTKLLEEFNFLLQNGLNPNELDETNISLLTVTIIFKLNDFFSLLLNSNADIYLKSSNNISGKSQYKDAFLYPIEIALSYGSADSIDALIKKGYDYDNIIGFEAYTFRNLLGKVIKKSVDFEAGNFNKLKEIYNALGADPKDQVNFFVRCFDYFDENLTVYYVARALIIAKILQILYEHAVAYFQQEKVAVINPEEKRIAKKEKIKKSKNVTQSSVANHSSSTREIYETAIVVKPIVIESPEEIAKRAAVKCEDASRAHAQAEKERLEKLAADRAQRTAKPKAITSNIQESLKEKKQAKLLEAQARKDKLAAVAQAAREHALIFRETTNEAKAKKLADERLKAEQQLIIDAQKKLAEAQEKKLLVLTKLQNDKLEKTKQRNHLKSYYLAQIYKLGETFSLNKIVNSSKLDDCFDKNDLEAFVGYFSLVCNIYRLNLACMAYAQLEHNKNFSAEKELRNMLSHNGFMQAGREAIRNTAIALNDQAIHFDTTKLYDDLVGKQKTNNNFANKETEALQDQYFEAWVNDMVFPKIKLIQSVFAKSDYNSKQPQEFFIPYLDAALALIQMVGHDFNSQRANRLKAKYKGRNQTAMQILTECHHVRCEFAHEINDNQNHLYAKVKFLCDQIALLPKIKIEPRDKINFDLNPENIILPVCQPATEQKSSLLTHGHWQKNSKPKVQAEQNPVIFPTSRSTPGAY